MKRLFAILCLLLVGCNFFSAKCCDAKDEPLVELRDGDRVIFIGGTFIERMQNFGYLESLLTAAQPNRHVTFRNLGWSGDTVWGDSRGVFGGPKEGFDRLVKDAKETKPTLIVICFGGNEAYAGPKEIPNFVVGLNRLLDTLAETKARFVLLTPFRHEPASPLLPNPQSYNDDLRKYCDAIQEVAASRKIPSVDLYDATPNGTSKENAASPLTFNGQHLTEVGDWTVAEKIARAFGYAPTNWKIDIKAEPLGAQTEGVEVTNVSKLPNGIRFDGQDKTLPYPQKLSETQINGEKRSVKNAARVQQLKITGLAPGKYELRVDGQKVTTADAAKWAEGSDHGEGFYDFNPPSTAQWQELRRTIADKNIFYFYRFRPQNETYLFLFRKHEQGNNAVEIPQFDPLIEEKEKQIALLRQPKKQTYELIRVSEK